MEQACNDDPFLQHWAMQLKSDHLKSIRFPPPENHP
jgi:hypothetical protein